MVFISHTSRWNQPLFVVYVQDIWLEVPELDLEVLLRSPAIACPCSEEKNGYYTIQMTHHSSEQP